MFRDLHIDTVDLQTLSQMREIAFESVDDIELPRRRYRLAFEEMVAMVANYLRTDALRPNYQAEAARAQDCVERFFSLSRS